jgi:adenylate kinase family enzyme
MTELINQNIDIIFVLGRPGSGKSVQCTKIAEVFIIILFINSSFYIF